MLSSFRSTLAAWRWRLVALLILVAAAGCGGSKLYPVEGKVIFPDDTPLTAGTVEFGPVDKDAILAPRGEIQADGTFRMSTFKEGDGAPEGEYRVLVTPPENADPDRPRPKSFDPRFTSFEKSGLKYTVKPGKNEFFTITVEKRSQKGPS
jgi:hypothetical protein